MRRRRALALTAFRGLVVIAVAKWTERDRGHPPPRGLVLGNTAWDGAARTAAGRHDPDADRRETVSGTYDHLTGTIDGHRERRHALGVMDPVKRSRHGHLHARPHWCDVVRHVDEQAAGGGSWTGAWLGR